jgi:hypothetical protein
MKNSSRSSRYKLCRTIAPHPELPGTFARFPGVLYFGYFQKKADDFRVAINESNAHPEETITVTDNLAKHGTIAVTELKNGKVISRFVKWRDRTGIRWLPT